MRDGLAQFLPRVFVGQLLLLDQAQRRGRARPQRQRAEIVEPLCDLLPVTHHVGGAALAERQQRGLFGPAGMLQAVAARGILDRQHQGRIQRGRHGAELFDREPFHFLEDADRIRSLRVTDALQLTGHQIFPLAVDAVRPIATREAA